MTVILTDIEGTTTPIAFVHDVLFPYARARFPEFVAAHADDAEIAPILAGIRRLAPGQTPAAALLGWMDLDAKVTPLKTLQGIVWREGYRDGSLKGEIYADVAPALRRWAAAGVRLYVYSSGSVAAQQLIFGHSVAGDLASLFSGFFDTVVGPKRAAASYAAIAAAIGVPCAEILFLSDVAAELDAAAAAGLRTCQLVRPTDGTIATDRHAVAADFTEIDPAAG